MTSSHFRCDDIVVNNDVGLHTKTVQSLPFMLSCDSSFHLLTHSVTLMSV